MACACQGLSFCLFLSKGGEVPSHDMRMLFVHWWDYSTDAEHIAQIFSKLCSALAFIRKSTSTILRTPKKLRSFPLMFILTDGISVHLPNRAIHVSLFSRIHWSN